MFWQSFNFICNLAPDTYAIQDLTKPSHTDFSPGDDLFLERLKAGDRNAFTLLFEYYYTGLVVFADHHLHDMELAEDIVQSAFVRLWENRQAIKSPSVRYYLASAVKNNCIDLIRKNETQRKYAQRLSFQETDHGQDFWAESELQQMIETAIGNLPQRCREIFILSRYEGLKSHEIAQKLQLSQRTVETQITNALKILRKDLKDYLFQLFLTF
ncbi:RNA polymerase sigma-70 factor [Gaoshiqia sediminis]|uniref:RNA polymerase sigma-70 factor n=1 Tax=Gaoshiqia sediminis TaxID=2986998 RepID=A0AA41YD70_9BACT|nr:RNA polymerase sigma-70 factor [Gaoshiqia sediminis]MCW0484553.1 RNA polymerase sigma-70 factor [Gaoshiqia sediminis]